MEQQDLRDRFKRRSYIDEPSKTQRTNRFRQNREVVSPQHPDDTTDTVPEAFKGPENHQAQETEQRPITPKQMPTEDLKMSQEEVLIPSTSPLSEPSTNRVTRSFGIGSLSRRPLITAGVAGLLLVGGGIGFLVLRRPSADPKTLAAVTNIPANSYAVSLRPGVLEQYQKLLAFPLFYPKTLPNNYTLDQDSYQTDQTLLSFTIKRDDKKTIVVTEQPLAVDITIPESDRPDGVSTFQPRNYSTDIGSVNIIKRGGKIIALVTTQKTMLIFNISNIPNDEADSIIRSFVPL